MNAKRINLNQLNKLLLAIFLLTLILHLGKLFLIPVAIAAFFAMLLYPFAIRLQRLGFKKSTAALSAILLVLVVVGGLGTVVYQKLANLKTDLPQIEQKIEERTNSLQGVLSETTDISEFEQDVIIEQKKPDILKEVGRTLKNFLVKGLYFLLQIFIVLTYTFFFLVYRHIIHNFFIKVNWFHNQEESRRVFLRITRVVHDYLQGTFIVISVLAVIYTLGFWSIGLDHALLFALITALLRIVPYFGSFLGIAFPIAFSILTQDSVWQPVLILLFFMATQLLEANLLTPYITGSRVKLNPLFTIMAILLGSLIWGVPGMVLFVPFFGILRIIFDEIPQLHPYGYILGNEEEEIP